MTFFNSMYLNNQARSPHIRFSPQPRFGFGGGATVIHNHTVIDGGRNSFGRAFLGAFLGGTVAQVGLDMMRRPMGASLFSGSPMMGGGYYPQLSTPTFNYNASAGLTGLNSGAESQTTPVDEDLQKLKELLGGVKIVSEGDGKYTINTGKAIKTGTYDEIKAYMDKQLAADSKKADDSDKSKKTNTEQA